MIRTMPTEEMIIQAKQTFAEYGQRLRPNRKTGRELVDYLRARYDVTPLHDARADEVIVGNVMENAHFREKLPAGKEAEPVVFTFVHDGKRGFVGVDTQSGMYHVEDDEEMWDDLCAFQGLDTSDLKNFFCVYMYVECLKKAGRLDDVLKG